MMWDVPLQISCIVRKEKKEKKKRQKDAFLFFRVGLLAKAIVASRSTQQSAQRTPALPFLEF